MRLTLSKVPWKNSVLVAISILLLQKSTDAISASISSQRDNSGNIIFMADNPDNFPYWAQINLNQYYGYQLSTKPHFAFPVPAGADRLEVMRLIKIKKNAAGVSWQSRIFPGKDPSKTKHDDSHLYRFPFAHGEKYKVGQGYFGGRTHKAPNAYALDFNMPVGTQIHSARDGIVTDIKYDSSVGGPHQRYSRHSNYIIIMHSDATFANYAHLKKNGVMVRKGERVKAGQMIGLSGNTGYSSGPHLHFDVFKYDNQGRSRNLPVRFYDHQLKPLTEVTEGYYYYAVDSAGPAFDIELGRQLKSVNIAPEYGLPQSGKISVNSDRIDDTILLFVENGTPSEHSMKIALQLNNLQSDQGRLIDINVPPLTRQAITVLQPINPKRQARFSYEILKGKADLDSRTPELARSEREIIRTDDLKVIKKQTKNGLTLFARNGYTETRLVNIRISVLGGNRTEPVNLSARVPALSEIFLYNIENFSDSQNMRISYVYEWN